MSDATEPVPAHPDNPRHAYRQALRCCETSELRALAARLGAEGDGRPMRLVEQIAELLDAPRVAASLVGGLDRGPQVALGLFAMTEQAEWPDAGLVHALRCLGVHPDPAIAALRELGLVVTQNRSQTTGENETFLIAHPAAMSEARTQLPPGPGPPIAGRARQVREADGLEILIRLAALWQRVVDAPLRQTQQGTLYKKDRERLDDDPALAGPIADRLEPLPDMVPLWLALARGVGLVETGPGGDCLVAAPAAFWAENAVHLPRMVALRWLGLSSWHDLAGWQAEDGVGLLAAPFVRPAVLLWLAHVPESDWIAIEDLKAHLDQIDPDWSRLVLKSADLPAREVPALAGRRGRVASSQRAGPTTTGLLDALLLGAAYQLGLVRAGEEDPGGRRVVQLTPLGRYVLALGPPPRREVAEQFLFVQPNFEVVAYRQGLTPALIGQLARFVHLARPGAALELTLTPEDAYRGLEGGLSAVAMLDRLGRHAARPLPAGVAEALRSWASRRERVSFHVAATLIEFASPEDLDASLAAWPPGPEPVRVTDRLLLIDDEASIPYDRFRMLGARNYRGPAEDCVTVEPDGITLTIDPGRSDLFVEAEVARLAEALPVENSGPAALRRRFRITPEALGRAVAAGFGPAPLERWFEVRTGAAMPPATRLMLHAVVHPDAPPTVGQFLVLVVASADLLEGLCQHPATRDFLGRRLGPTAVAVPAARWQSLRLALRQLGLEPWRDVDGETAPFGGDPEPGTRT